MEQAETLQRSAAAAEKEYAKTQAAIQEQIARLEAGAQGATDRLRELESDRTRLGTSIAETTLELYQRLFVKKGDAAVVPLEHDICGGCHMKVPTQAAALVRAEHGIVQCPQCGRILYRVL